MAFGYCDLHGKEVSEETFEWKGCWSCSYFSYDEDFPYVDVSEAAQIFKVSNSTIRRWLSQNKLKGKLFVRGRYLSFLSSPYQKYFIEKNSINDLCKRKNIEKEVKRKKKDLVI